MPAGKIIAELRDIYGKNGCPGRYKVKDLKKISMAASRDKPSTAVPDGKYIDNSMMDYMLR